MPKIGLSKTIFYGMNHMNLSKIEFYFKNIGELLLMLTFLDNSNFQIFHFPKSCPVFVDSALCPFTNYNTFFGGSSVLA